MKKIVIVAGDPSGDLYASFLAKKLKQKFPALEIFSFAGPHSAKYTRQIVNLLEYSVAGIIEVAFHLKKILSIFKKILDRINNIEPDLIILIDFPDFNLKLARTLNKKFPIFYYVSPQVWAWRQKRVKLIKQFVDKMVVIFGFEKDFYEKEKIDVLYFGHPLLEIIKKEAIETKKIISFLPGSRRNEVNRHLPLMQKTKNILENELKDYRFRIIKPRNLEKEFYQKSCPEIEVVDHSYRAIQESKFIIASSGTATVEIAILEVPHLIVYRVNPLSWQILKRLVKTEFIGMINILNGSKIIDELLQDSTDPARIASLTLSYLRNKEKYLRLKNSLVKTKELLLPAGATEKFAEFIGGYLRLYAS